MVYYRANCMFCKTLMERCPRCYSWICPKEGCKNHVAHLNFHEKQRQEIEERKRKIRKKLKDSKNT